jgi:hypothetical protein
MHIEIKTPTRLTKGDTLEIYASVEESMEVKLSTKGKKVINADIRRKMLHYNNDVDRVKSFFKNYHDEMKKLYYYGWDNHDKKALVYHLTN